MYMVDFTKRETYQLEGFVISNIKRMCKCLSRDKNGELVINFGRLAMIYNKTDNSHLKQLFYDNWYAYKELVIKHDKGRFRVYGLNNLMIVDDDLYVVGTCYTRYRNTNSLKDNNYFRKVLFENDSNRGMIKQNANSIELLDINIKNVRSLDVHISNNGMWITDYNKSEVMEIMEEVYSLYEQCIKYKE